MHNMFTKTHNAIIFFIFIYITNITSSEASQTTQDILNLLAKGEKSMKIDENYNNIILVLGISGSGKSTFTQYMAGDNNKLVSVKVGNNLIIQDMNNTIIGNDSTIISKTIIPELVVSKSNLAFYDCPGFSDTRTLANDISTTYFIKKVLKSSRTVKLVFTVNHNAVIEGQDRHNFMILVRHAISFIKDIDKFKNSFVLIVTKVTNYAIGDNGESIFLKDDDIIRPIVDFLTNAKQQLTGREKQFIEILLDFKKNNKIGLFRTPNKRGNLTNIELLQKGKESLEKIIDGINFITYNISDFGFAISSDSKNDIHDLFEAIYENIRFNISIVAEKIISYYTNLFEQMSHKINSFNNNTADIDVDQLEVQILSAKLNNGYNITEILFNDIKNLINVEELTEKINISITSIGINIIEDNSLINIENQIKYLTFLQNIYDKKINTRQWDTLFADIVTYLSDSRNNIQNNIYNATEHIENIIISDINIIANSIQEYFENKIAVFKVNKLSLDIKHAYNVIISMIMSSSNQKNMEEVLKIMYDSISDLNIPILNKNIKLNIEKHRNNLEFLQVLSDNRKNNGFITWMNPFQDVVKYLDTSRIWYTFLDSLYEKFSEFQIQEKKNIYNVANISDWGEQNKTQGIRIINKNDFDKFLDKISKFNITENYYVKNITVTPSQFMQLNQVLNLTLNHEVNISCPTPNKLVVIGQYIKFSDFITIDGKLVSADGCMDVSILNIFSLNTVFFDTNLVNVGNELHVNIIAPKWEIIDIKLDNRKIILDGSPGDEHNPKKATSAYVGNEVNGIDGEPGLPGGSSGYFLGIGRNFINVNHFYVSTNGGNGGPGQIGSDGKDGKNGNKPEIPTSSETSVNYTSIWEKNGCIVLNLGIRSKLFESFNELIIYCKNCTNGGSGGNGGQGGYGGNNGIIRFISISNDTILNFSNEKGKVGKHGDKGLDGKPGASGEFAIIKKKRKSCDYYESNSYPNLNPCFKYTIKNEGKLPSCIVSNRYENTKIKQNDIASKSQLINPSFIVNEYKKYLRENLSGSIRESYIKEFLDQLDNNESVMDLYDTLGLVDELQGLESQYFKLHREISLLPHYKSLLKRINKYAGMPKDNEKSEEYKKVQSYLYTAILGKILIIDNDSSSNLIINIKDYLDLLQKKIDNFKDSSRVVQNKNTEEDYVKNMDAKIYEANQLIDQDLTLEINNIISQIDQQINLLINETIEYQNKAINEIQNIKKQQEKLQNSLVLRKFLGIIQVGSQLLAFLGPIGATAGSMIGGISMVTQTLVLDNNGPQGLDKIAALPAAVGKAIPKITEQYKRKQTSLKLELEKAEKDLADFNNPEMTNDDSLKQIRDKISKLKTRMKEDEKNNFLYSSYYDKQELQELLTKKINKLKQTKNKSDYYIEKKLQIYERVQYGISVGEVFVDTFSRIQNDEAKIKNVNNAIKEVKDKIIYLEKYEQDIYKIIIPMFKGIYDDVETIKKSSVGKSHVTLDVSKWKIQNTIKDVQGQMKQLTKGFTVNESIIHFIEKLEYGMVTMIQVYDRIQDYHDRSELANYIADINSVNANKITISNSELSNAIEDLELIIQSNLVLDQYEKAINAFKQYIFPFAHSYLNVFQLPVNLQLKNTTSNLVTKAIDKIQFLEQNLKHDSTSILQRDKNIFSDVIFNIQDDKSFPFIVWKHNSHKEVISKLLKGQQVMIKADISKGIEESAVKFKEIGIRFKLVNTKIQDELDIQLDRFSVEMIHLGNSYYKCDNKVYIMSHYNETIIHSINKDNNGQYLKENNVYKKIKNNDPLLSPYTWWKIKLIKGNFSVIAKYISQEIDIALEGRGGYIKPDDNICNNNLDNYYTLDNTISDTNDIN